MKRHEFRRWLHEGPAAISGPVKTEADHMVTRVVAERFGVPVGMVGICAQFDAVHQVTLDEDGVIVDWNDDPIEAAVFSVTALDLDNAGDAWTEVWGRFHDGEAWCLGHRNRPMGMKPVLDTIAKGVSERPAAGGPDVECADLLDLARRPSEPETEVPAPGL